MKTPIRYSGGKSKAYDVITSEIPKMPYPNRIISPFIGGGSLESRWSSEIGIEVIGYDIFDALTNFWNILLTNPDGLADKLNTLVSTKEKYNEIKEILIRWDYTQEILSEWKTGHYKRDDIITLDNLTAAAYYFYNHNLSYGPEYLGWISKIYENQDKWDRVVERIREYKNPKLQVNKGSFDEVIPNHANDFLYLDPPYYLAKEKDNKMFKGLYPNGNWAVHHNEFDHEKLRDLLHNHKGDFILSYNDCETIREYYKDFKLSYPQWHSSYAYNFDKSKNTERNSKESHEILICKFSIDS